MSIVTKVHNKLEEIPAADDLNLNEALAEAERLADVFADVKPQPYVIPIERFAGLPVAKGATLWSFSFKNSLHNS